jgi:hypothetical protein
VDFVCTGTPSSARPFSAVLIELFVAPSFAVTPDDLVIYKLVAGLPQELLERTQVWRHDDPTALELNARG